VHFTHKLSNETYNSDKNSKYFKDPGLLSLKKAEKRYIKVSMTFFEGVYT
jgi:hypothetical protein